MRTNQAMFKMWQRRTNQGKEESMQPVFEREFVQANQSVDN
jgi:hypothetical protein